MGDILQYVQVLGGPGVGALIAAALFRVVRHYVAKVRDDRLRALLMELAKAAEQIYGPGKGAAKRRYVQEQAQRRGFGEVGQEQIEAAVYDLNHGNAPAGG